MQERLVQTQTEDDEDTQDDEEHKMMQPLDTLNQSKRQLREVEEATQRVK